MHTLLIVDLVAVLIGWVPVDAEGKKVCREAVGGEVPVITHRLVSLREKWENANA
jgi:hypothetical protein